MSDAQPVAVGKAKPRTWCMKFFRAEAGTHPNNPERKCKPKSNGKERNGEPDTQKPGAHG